jgi:hypothetical protein
MEPLSTNDSVIPVVITNPKPQQSSGNIHSERAMMKPNPSQPEAPCLLQPKRRVLKVAL